MDLGFDEEMKSDINPKDRVKTPKNKTDDVDNAILDAIMNKSDYGTASSSESKLTKVLVDTGIKTPTGRYIQPELLQIDPKRVKVSPYNKRNQKNLDVSDLEPEIRPHGTNLMPVLVRQIEGDQDYDYELVYGSRRRYVCERNKFPLTALCADMEDEDVIFFATIENSGQKALNPFEQSEQYQLFIDSKKPLFKSTSDLAKGIGKSRGATSRIYNFKTVPQELYCKLNNEKITVRNASTVKKLWDALGSNQKNVFLEDLRENDSLTSVSEMINRLSDVSPAEVFKAVKSEFDYGNEGRAIVEKTLSSGNVKYEFITNSGLSESNLKKLKEFINQIVT
jgi:ParB/RepB/Spo0J family partition protein